MFIHQLAREVWWYETSFPLNAVGYVLEPLYLRPYRATRVITVSQSTKQDLRRLHFTGDITVIPEGLEPIKVDGLPKRTEPTFLYVGRLAPSKRVEHIIQAFAQFCRQTRVGQLELIGTGQKRYEATLERLALRLSVRDRVQFLGRVSTAEKHRLMAGATAILLTSVREGWGLVVSEANACGTPAIVYDVPGLRDSVRNEATGLVVAPEPTNLYLAMDRLIRDGPLYNRLVSEGKRWSKTLSFDDSANAVVRTLAIAIGS